MTNVQEFEFSLQKHHLNNKYSHHFFDRLAKNSDWREVNVKKLFRDKERVLEKSLDVIKLISSSEADKSTKKFNILKTMIRKKRNIGFNRNSAFVGRNSSISNMNSNINSMCSMNNTINSTKGFDNKAKLNASSVSPSKSYNKVLRDKDKVLEKKTVVMPFKSPEKKKVRQLSTPSEMTKLISTAASSKKTTATNFFITDNTAKASRSYNNIFKTEVGKDKTMGVIKSYLNRNNDNNINNNNKNDLNAVSESNSKLYHSTEKARQTTKVINTKYMNQLFHFVREKERGLKRKSILPLEPLQTAQNMQIQNIQNTQTFSPTKTETFNFLTEKSLLEQRANRVLKTDNSRNFLVKSTPNIADREDSQTPLTSIYSIQPSVTPVTPTKTNNLEDHVNILALARNIKELHQQIDKKGFFFMAKDNNKRQKKFFSVEPAGNVFSNSEFLTRMNSVTSLKHRKFFERKFEIEFKKNEVFGISPDDIEDKTKSKIDSIHVRLMKAFNKNFYERKRIVKKYHINDERLSPHRGKFGV